MSKNPIVVAAILLVRALAMIAGFALLAVMCWSLILLAWGFF